MTTYQIRDWNKHFEKADTKKCVSTKWVPVPNKWDGKSYRRLIRMKDGIALFGCWVLIIQVASRCPNRGVLADDDGPLTPEDIADKTGCKSEIIEKALEVLSSNEIGWITRCESPETSGTLRKFPGDAGNFRDATENLGLQDRTGQDRTEQELPTEVCSEPPTGDSEPVMVFPCSGKDSPGWTLREAKVAEYRESFPGIDVLAECRKARQWCIDNSQRRKSVGGMPAFLSRWLSKAQDNGGRNGKPQGNFGKQDSPSRVRETGPSQYDNLPFHDV